ncbi:MAG: helix-turn-helix transcriptional regulator [Pseudomonadota bacterium]
MATLSDHPADEAAAPVVGESWDAQGPRALPFHSHRRGQLIYTARGCVTVEAKRTLFVVPINRALWVPPGVVHNASYPQEVAFRGIFVAPELCRDLPETVCFVQIDPLARELIETAARLPWDYPAKGPEARLMRVLLDQIEALPQAPLTLPDVDDDRLKRATAALRAAPADERPLGDWASLAGMSQRNFTRRFRAETGMSFAAWRQQLLILHAVEKLALGDPVTRVAVDLGFASTSGFTAMFKRNTGTSPSAYLRTHVAAKPERTARRGRGSGPA